ncbi:MAG: hypothetical protein ACLR0U_28075 [Enterocloster clostridioformis]
MTVEPLLDLGADRQVLENALESLGWMDTICILAGRWCAVWMPLILMCIWRRMGMDIATLIRIGGKMRMSA